VCAIVKAQPTAGTELVPSVRGRGDADPEPRVDVVPAVERERIRSAIAEPELAREPELHAFGDEVGVGAHRSANQDRPEN
jgi:hypothetical protein